MVRVVYLLEFFDESAYMIEDWVFVCDIRGDIFHAVALLVKVYGVLFLKVDHEIFKTLEVSLEPDQVVEGLFLLLILSPF